MLLSVVCCGLLLVSVTGFYVEDSRDSVEDSLNSDFKYQPVFDSDESESYSDDESESLLDDEPRSFPDDESKSYSDDESESYLDDGQMMPIDDSKTLYDTADIDDDVDDNMFNNDDDMAAEDDDIFTGDDDAEDTEPFDSSSTKERMRRSLTSFVRVLQVVLLDARLVEIGHNLKNFVKLGGSKQAHRDFDALHATDVMAHGHIKTGWVGDTYVTLHNNRVMTVTGEHMKKGSEIPTLIQRQIIYQ